MNYHHPKRTGQKPKQQPFRNPPPKEKTVLDMSEEEFVKDPLQRALVVLNLTCAALGMHELQRMTLANGFAINYKRFTDAQMRDIYQTFQAAKNKKEIVSASQELTKQLNTPSSEEEVK